MSVNGVFNILECNKLAVGGKHVKGSPPFLLKADTEFYGDVTFRSGTLKVSQDISVAGTVHAQSVSLSSVFNLLTVRQDILIEDQLSVSGTANITGNVALGNDLDLTNGAGLIKHSAVADAANSLKIESLNNHIDITGTRVALVSKDNTASAISLTTNQGTDETIVITNTQGTSNGAITLTATAGGVDINAGTASSFTTSAGALTLDGAGGVNIQGNAAEIDLTTTGALDINAAATTIDSSAGVAITAATASSFTTAAGALTLTGAAASTWSTAAGALTLDGAGGVNIQGNAAEIDLTTTGALDINAAATTIDSSAGVAITAATASSFTTAAGALTLTGAAASTWSTGAGALTLDGAGGVNINCNTSEKMRITTTGNVGIGTDQPRSYFDHLNPNGPALSRSADEKILNIHNNDDDISRLVLSAGTYHTASIYTKHEGYGMTYLGFETSGDVRVSPENGTPTERMRIDYLGNVGIGTTTPRAYYNSTPTNFADTERILNIHNNSHSVSRLVLSAGSDHTASIKTEHTGNGYTYMSFQTSNPTLDDRMRIDKDGNVGIGTTTPTDKLDVNGTLHLRAGTTSDYSGMNTIDSTNRTGTYIKFGDAGTANDIALLRQIGGSDSYHMVLDFHDHHSDTNFSIRGINSADGNVSSITKFTIQNNNVGIGTASPSELLHIDGTNSSILFGGTWASGNYHRIVGQNPAKKIEFNYDTGTIIADNNSIVFMTDYTSNTHTERMRITNLGNVGIGTTSPSGKLDVNGSIVSVGSSAELSIVSRNAPSTKTWTIYSESGDLQFYSQTSGVDRLIVKSTGNVGIGTTTPGAKLEVNGTGIITGTLNVTDDVNTAKSLFVGSMGSLTYGAVGEIRATGNVTSYYSSDIRLKKNIRNISDPLNKINKINGVSFEWTQEHIEKHGGEDDYFMRKNDIGIIAQEIEAVLPEVVATKEDGFKAVRYEKLAPLLIESVKELSNKNNNLEEKNQKLTKNIETLEKENLMIKAQLSKILEKLNML